MRRTIWCLLGLVLAGCGDDGSSASGSTAATTDQTTTGGSTSTTTEGSTAAGSGDTGSPQGCGPWSADNLRQCVDTSAITDDVGFIADIRTPGSTHWQAVQELCADRLTQLGFEVQLFEYATGIDVIGRLPGTTAPDEVVMISAHYDHIPDCLGADDNATGVAGALEAARVLSQAQFERTLTVACWDEEETGLVGSEAFAAALPGSGLDVVVVYNYDMIGFTNDEPNTQQIPTGFDLLFAEEYAEIEANEFRADFIVIVGDDLAMQPWSTLVEHADAIGLPNAAVVLDGTQKNNDLFADLRRSDHASFWALDIPAIFLTDSADFRNDAYHCLGGEDTVDTLDFEFATDVVAATVGSAAETLVVVPR